jgi:hypothetical protein
MKLNKKTLAKELASSLRVYSSMVDYFDSKNDEKMAAHYRGKAYGIQDLAMTIFGVENMCGYWKSGLIEELEKVAK